MIIAPATSHQLAPSARAAALPRTRLYHLHFFHMLRRLRLQQCTTRIAACPGHLVFPVKSGKEFICRTRARCRLVSFFLNSYSCVNFNKFLFSSQNHCYIPLIFSCSYLSSSLLIILFTDYSLSFSAFLLGLIPFIISLLLSKQLGEMCMSFFLFLNLAHVELNFCCHRQK